MALQGPSVPQGSAQADSHSTEQDAKRGKGCQSLRDRGELTAPPGLAERMTARPPGSPMPGAPAPGPSWQVVAPALRALQTLSSWLFCIYRCRQQEGRSLGTMFHVHPSNDSDSQDEIKSSPRGGCSTRDWSHVSPNRAVLKLATGVLCPDHRVCGERYTEVPLDQRTNTDRKLATRAAHAQSPRFSLQCSRGWTAGLAAPLTSSQGILGVLGHGIGFIQDH